MSALIYDREVGVASIDLSKYCQAVTFIDKVWGVTYMPLKIGGSETAKNEEFIDEKSAISRNLFIEAIRGKTFKKDKHNGDEVYAKIFESIDAKQIIRNKRG